MYKVDKNKGLKCFVDTDFARGQTPNNPLNLDNILSRSRFIIMHAGVPVFQESNLQTEITLSICEAKYIALSTVIREVIPLM